MSSHSGSDLKPSRTFRQIFSEKNQCSPKRFVRKVFWASLHREHFWVAAFVRIFKPGYFARDLAVIERLGQSVTEEEFEEALWELQEMNELEINTFRVNWLLRVSVQRLMDLRERTLANPVLASQPKPARLAA